MTTRLEVRAEWKGRMAFTGRGHTGVAVPIDYVAPLGEDKGVMPLELLLMSLATCSGVAVATLLARGGQNVAALEVEAVGDRRDDHPTVFTAIRLRFRLRGADLDRSRVDGAIRTAEERLCPVWAMLRPAVTLSSEYEIES